MGVRILNAVDQAALYCSTTDWAFGPVFTAQDGHDAEERAEMFSRWLKVDPRGLTDAELRTAYLHWRAQEATQWAAEDAAQEALW